VERLPLKPGSESIMSVELRKVAIPVAAGRNLAVLTEAAVRNYVLQLRGIDSTREFIERQAEQLESARDDDDKL
jgi:HPr kinase/phosphorylase